MQLLFVRCLDAELADERGAGVLGELLFFLETLDVVLADRGHVAERMHRMLAVRIETGQARGDVHAGKFEAVHGETRDFLVGEPQPDGNALEAAAGTHQCARLVQVVCRQHADGHQPLQRGIHVWHALAHQLELERGTVLRENRAVAIEDEAALCRQGLDAYPVALRQVRVIVVAEDLQHYQPAHQHQREQRDDDGRRQCALLEQPLLAPVVLDADGAHAKD
jgi:hypothetical protein